MAQHYLVFYFLEVMASPHLNLRISGGRSKIDLRSQRLLKEVEITTARKMETLLISSVLLHPHTGNILPRVCGMDTGPKDKFSRPF